MGEKETASQFAASDDSLNDPDEPTPGKPSKEQRTSGDGSGAAAEPPDPGTTQVIKTKTKSNQSND